MTRNTHDIVNDHFGVAEQDQIASGTPTAGYYPAAHASGTAVWTVVPESGGLLDILTGDDANFTSTVGNWTSSSGTVSRDTTYKITGTTASLKWEAPNSGTAYVSVPLSGTFTAGVTYAILVYLSIEESDTTARTLYAGLGLFGTDSTFNSVAFTCATNAPGQGSAGMGWYAAVAYWTPSANRTGVTLRITSATAATATVHVGAARAWKTPTVGEHKIGSISPVIPAANGDLQLSPWGGGGGVAVTSSGRVVIDNSASSAGYLMSNGSIAEAYSYQWAEHTPGDFPQAGIEMDAGTDYVPLFVSEKDSATIQVYSYVDNDIELADRGTGTVNIRNSSGVIKQISLMEERKASGSATVASGTTSISVTHGAGYTPTAADLVVTPTNNPTNDPGWFWISNVGATTFDINVRNDPGTGGATFTWRADR